MSLSSDDIRDNFESYKRGTRPKKKMAYCKICKKFVDRNNHEHFSKKTEAYCKICKKIVDVNNHVHFSRGILTPSHKDPDDFIPFTPGIDNQHWLVRDGHPLEEWYLSASNTFNGVIMKG